MLRKLALASLLVLFAASIASNAQVTFSSQTYPLTQAPYQVVTGDFNGDGRPDVAVLSVAGGTVSILLTNADGTLSAARDFPAIAAEGDADFGTFNGIAVGDVNGDGKLDLVVADPGRDPLSGAAASINVLLGNGDGTFQPAVSTALTFLVQADALIGIADFNGDKKLDVALFGTDGSSLGPFAMLGNGDGTFAPGVIASAGFGPTGSAVTDVNGDGKTDLVFTTLDANGLELMVLLGNGDGTFSLLPSAPSPAASIVMGDFNHDGKSDLALTSLQGQECEFGVCHTVGPPGALAVLLGAGDGTFAGPGVLASGNYGFAATGDFDGDGNLDLVALGSPSINPAPSVIMLGDGRGNFPTQVGVSFSNAAAGMVSADFNGDGLADIVLLNSGLQVELNTTPGFFLAASGAGSGISPGASSTYTINIGQQNDFSNAVTLACTAPASAGIGCSLSPSSVTPGGSSTLTVITTAASNALVRPPGHSPSRLFYAAWLPVGAFLFGAIGFAERQVGKRKLAALVLACVVSSGLILQTACGGGSSNKSGGTPAGSYTITITGTSGSLQRSTTAALTVQ